MIPHKKTIQEELNKILEKTRLLIPPKWIVYWEKNPATENINFVLANPITQEVVEVSLSSEEILETREMKIEQKIVKKLKERLAAPRIESINP